MPSVYYKRLIEGVTVPSVIHNVQYYYIAMPVFEDGSIDCWGRVSFRELNEKLSKGWLVTEIPEGEAISIHGLGSYTVQQATWDYTPESYAAYVKDCIQQMNHNMVGLFEETQEQTEKWKTRKAGWRTSAKPYRIKGNFGYRMLDGASTSLFVRSTNGWTLSSVTAYADGTLALEATGQALTLEELNDMFASDTLSGDIEGEFELTIPSFARFTATARYQTPSEEKRKEVMDLLAKTAGEKISLEHCRYLYQEYLIYPTELHREQLRKAYEAVPKHQRMFLGDMDMKDADYIRILYHPERKREV